MAARLAATTLPVSRASSLAMASGSRSGWSRIYALTTGPDAAYITPAATAPPSRPATRAVDQRLRAEAREGGSVAIGAAMLLVALDLGARHHGDVLGPDPVARAGRERLQRLLGMGEREARFAFQIVALRGRQRGAALVPFAVVDDAELVPGVGIGIVAADGAAQHRFGLLEILGVV